ncbi:hypothetical protein P9112_008798 [Eukaryota sp. TZLM1-RC]
MKLVDLSHTLENGMPLYPGTVPVEIKQCNDIPTDGYEEVRFSMNTHVGTHIDSPKHMTEGATSLSDWDISQYHGKAVLIDLRNLGREFIEIDDLRPYSESLQGAEYVILHTGWSQFWGQEKYFEEFPTLSIDAANWLVQYKLKGIGMDCISPDPCSTTTFPIHHILMKKDMVITENLCNLDEIDAKEFSFSCFPLKFKNGDGSPVRAIAYIH